MFATLMPAPKPQFDSAAGVPLVGGRLHTYAAGTLNPKATYSDPNGAVPQANPIVLNARGEPNNAIFWSGAYYVELYDAFGNLVYTVDDFQTPVSSNELASDVGAGMVGFDYAEPYTVGTVGRWLVDFALAAGSSFVGFINTGVGAIVRSVQDVLRERVSVKDYGALCDGVTDDTAAVLKAQTVAGKRALSFPGITHIGVATTITAPIADTGAQIFSATSLVTIANGRAVKAAWFGAKPDGVTDSAPPTQRALVAAKSAPVELDFGTYRWDSGVTVKGNVVDGYNKLIGPGPKACRIDCYGAVPAIQSDQAALSEHVELSGFGLRKVGFVGTQIGLDLGTIRSSVVENILIEEFQVGLALRKNIDPIGNYYNHVRNLAIGAAGAPAGSIGVQIGNVEVGHLNPTGNANILKDIVIAGMETGLWIHGAGNFAEGMTIIGCDDAVVLIALNSLDNQIQAYIESQTGQSMGNAGAGTSGNELELFNDALNCTRFVDNGFNNIMGNVGAGGLGYLSPTRTLDCHIVDHLMFGKVGASFPVFSIKLPASNGALRVEVCLAGSIQFTANYGGTQRWAVNQIAGAVPVIGAVDSAGSNRFTVAAAADGTVTWSLTGDAVQPFSGQISVVIHGIASTPTNFGEAIIYNRIP